MYDLPEEFWWRWPINTTECHEGGYLTYNHSLLSGIGKVINAEDGLFLTWHFSLFSSLYNRLKRSRKRIRDPSLASLFIVPYDLSLDGYVTRDTCRNKRSCTKDLPSKLTEILTASSYFHRHYGQDHAVLWSLGQYHPWPRAGCDLFMKRTCANCTFTCYWMDATIADNNFISVPFPSAYHWHNKIVHIPWKAVKNSPQRNFTVVYLGSTKTLNPAHTKIRRAMTTQCNSSRLCHWAQIGHSSIDVSIADHLSLYRKSVFCLCPPGDDPARKAVFDSILSGCIPVIFEVATLFNQYPWHIGEAVAQDIAVNIPGGQVRSGRLNFMDVLLNISAEVIYSKQRAIERLAPRVQYAVPPLQLLEDRADESPWDPPFRDGVDVLLDGMFNRTERLLLNQRTGVPSRVMKASAWSQLYDEVIVKEPVE